MAESAAAQSSTQEDFAALLEESLGGEGRLEGTVLKGTVLGFDGDEVMIDVGLKSEGRVALKEFAKAGEDADLKEGGDVEVFLERYENRNGEVVLSREKARREEAWTQLERAFNNNERVTGQIFGRVKGGFTVDLNGAVAFLPGSQVDIRPVRDVTPLMGTPQPFQILKMDRSRGNIVVSRRAVLEETRAEQRSELVASLKEGQVLQGVVKNITDYGAFVDLGGVDGLLHVTDMSWKRVNHPTDILQIGQTVEVQVIRFNPDTQRISLGMKQLEADPWEGASQKYPTGAKFTGRVTNITDYGAFVELEPGIEGLVHVSEMSWTKKNIHPGKIVSTSQEVEVMILDVDEQKRRISLGLKQCLPNPWEEFKEKYPAGTELEGEVKNITEFGLFVGLPGDIDGMVHLSDLSWDRSGDEAVKDYQKGDQVKVKVLDVDTEKERISLGIKQLEDDPFEAAAGEVRKGQVVTCTVTEVQDNAIEVRVGDEDGPTGTIRKAELARDRSEQRPDRYAPGEKVDAKVTSVDKKNRRITLSIKQREIDEEKAAMAEYGSTDTGASLGEILGPAMRSAVKEATSEEEAKSGSKSGGAKKSSAKSKGDADSDES
ncbi:30S ribosomal protein S1 [Rhodovibrio sodomensis]|uniref:30S ribosomal protein S1 n=1 Tax=Rhodovibrio sodomensis TaxID=1088 RepID=A0ABS1D8M7_9PROT|nr:30S ribosomal protein S1 [Rhodovibrio sodomensis]MBK1666762.1 30S ribosomal protein S1 [Rhodovibrio sodomensis]